MSYFWAVVVAQLVERSIMTPEVHNSNPIIGKIYIQHCLLSTEVKDQNREKNVIFYVKHSRLPVC